MKRSIVVQDKKAVPSGIKPDAFENGLPRPVGLTS